MSTRRNVKKSFHLQSLEQVVREDVSIKKRQGWYNQLSSGAVFRLLEAHCLISLLHTCTHWERYHADFHSCA